MKNKNNGAVQVYLWDVFHSHFKVFNISFCIRVFCVAIINLLIFTLASKKYPLHLPPNSKFAYDSNNAVSGNNIKIITVIIII